VVEFIRGRGMGTREVKRGTRASHRLWKAGGKENREIVEGRQLEDFLERGRPDGERSRDATGRKSFPLYKGKERACRFPGTADLKGHVQGVGRKVT